MYIQIFKHLKIYLTKSITDIIIREVGYLEIISFDFKIILIKIIRTINMR